MLCGKTPFEAADVEGIYTRIRRCDYTFPQDVSMSEQVRDMIAGILRLEPRARPGLDAILGLPWFSGACLPPTMPPTVESMIARALRPSSALRSKTPEDAKKPTAATLATSRMSEEK